MNVVREIKEVIDGTISIDMPAAFLHRKVEVIVIPLDEIFNKGKDQNKKAWPPGFFEDTAGCFAGDPIRRAPQGEYEHREHFA